MKQKKVLIAGVAGFLGSHLADSLIASGLKVVGIDDWKIGNRKNIEHLFQNPQFDFIEANINQRVPDSLHREEWMAIIHVANTEIPHSGSRLELNELLTNSFGVKNLLDLALRTKSRFVLTSTIEIYQGLASHTSLSRYYEDNRRAGVLGFSEAKRYAEALCQEYAAIYGVDVRVARLAETYGPRMNLQSDSLTAELIKAGLDGKSLALEEVGSRTMYVTYYSDVIFGLNKLVVRDDENLKDGIFYLVNDEPVSVLSIVLTIKEYAPEKISVEFLPKVEDSLFELPRIDLSRSKNELYWDSKVSLQEGIKKTFSFFNDNDEIYKEKKTVPAEYLSSDKESEVKPVKELDASAFGFSSGDEEDQESDHLSEDDVVETDAKSIEESEKDVLNDLIEETEEELERPELEAPDDSGSLSKPSGWLSLKEKTKRFDLKGVSTKVTPRGRVQKILLGFVAVLLIWFIAIPTIGTFGHGVNAWYQLNKAQDAMGQADFAESEDRLANVSENLGDIQFYWQQGRWAWVVIGQGDAHASLLSLIQSGEALFEAGAWGVTFLEDTQPWWGPFVQGEDTTVYSDRRTTEQLAKTKLSWRVFRQNITLAKTLSSSVRNKQYPSILESRVKMYTQLVEQIASMSQLEDATWDSLPAWLGYEGKQEIVVLLQNNHEIRPGGGFIGSYALVTVDQGVIASLLIDDIYNPDGQLEGLPAEESPVTEPIAKYLNLDFLFSRDANWWPDFAKTGELFSSLYTRATGVEPEWVVGLNLGVIEELLGVVGEVTLPEQNVTISPENLFQEAEVAAEVAFEPGSTKKRDFLTEVAQQIWLQLFPVNAAKLSGVFEVLGKAAVQQELFLYSTNQSWQDTVTDSSLAGSITRTDSDYVYVVSSNVGGNKANYWIDRSQNYAIFVDRQGNLRAKLTITFTHNGQSESWPNGLYEDYLRVYVPQGSSLIESSGIKQDQTTYDEFGHTVFAGLVEVPINNSKDVEFSYTLPESLILSTDSPYELEILSQPGMEGESFALQLGLPLYLTAESATVGTNIADDYLSWETDLSGTHSYKVTVSEQQ